MEHSKLGAFAWSLSLLALEFTLTKHLCLVAHLRRQPFELAAH